jgi:hypothetical protein
MKRVHYCQMEGNAVTDKLLCRLFAIVQWTSALKHLTSAAQQPVVSY